MNKVHNDIKNKVDSSKLTEMLINITNDYKSKVDYTYMDNVVQKVKDDMMYKLKEHETSLKLELNKKLSSTDINVLLNNKLDKQSLNNKIIDKTEFNALKHNVELIISELPLKTNQSIFDSNIKSITSSLNDINTSLAMKANIRDTYNLLKNKAEIDDVNKALSSIHNELDNKVSLEQFTNAMDNQAIINDTLCTVNCIGRWMWKSGKVKHNLAVPWDTQNVNTAPDNYIWEMDCAYIGVVVGGLYEVSFGFYAEKRPAVQVIVNGDVVVNSLSYCSNGKGMISGKGKKGKGGEVVMGVTMCEVLMLPDNAKVSMSYSGEDGGVGFFGIKKI